MNTETEFPIQTIDTSPMQEHLPAAQADTSPAGMMMTMLSRGATLEQIEKMMDLNRRHMKDEAEKAYNVAFALFKSEAVRVLKNREVTDGPLKGKAYAELHAVVDAITPALSKHGLGASWRLTRDDKDWIEVTCTLKHALGHSESVSMGGPPDAGGAKNAIQARASTVSYLERYTLKAICGVAEGGQDDDGGHGNVEAERIELWGNRARSAATAKDLQDIRRSGTQAFEKAKDRAGYSAFAQAVKARAAELEAGHA